MKLFSFSVSCLSVCCFCANLLIHQFCWILYQTNKLFTVLSAIVNSIPSSVFPSEANGETKEQFFFAVEDFTPF